MAAMEHAFAAHSKGVVPDTLIERE